jgi:hypothetical protein
MSLKGPSACNVPAGSPRILRALEWAACSATAGSREEHAGSVRSQEAPHTITSCTAATACFGRVTSTVSPASRTGRVEDTTLLGS